MNIECDPKTHIYKIDGQEVISVTTALKEANLCDYSFIDEWYLQRGQAYHTAIEYYILGCLDWKTVDPVIKPFVDGAVKFLQDYDCETLGVEEIVGSKAMGVAGTMDYRCKIKGIHTLVDWKGDSGRRVDAVQLAGYRKLHNIMYPDGKIKRLMIVNLDGKGGYKVPPKSFYKATDESVFVSAVNIANFRRGML